MNSSVRSSGVVQAVEAVEASNNGTTTTTVALSSSEGETDLRPSRSTTITIRRLINPEDLLESSDFETAVEATETTKITDDSFPSSMETDEENEDYGDEETAKELEALLKDLSKFKIVLFFVSFLVISWGWD